MNVLRIVAAAALLSAVAACAEPARTAAMVAPATPTTTVAESSPLRNSIEITEVSGGQETDPLWTSEVSNSAFRQALELTLKQHTLLAEGDGPLDLTANLVAMDQPFGGFNMTVSSTVVYRIRNAAGERVFDEIVTVPYTANFSDAFAGVERLRLANEGTIKANIGRFLEILIQQASKNPETFGGLEVSGL